MSYQKLLQTILQHGPAEVAAMQAALNRATDFTDPTVIQVVQQLPDFEHIFHNVNALSTADRSRFLARLNILADREKVTIPRFIKPTKSQQRQIQRRVTICISNVVMSYAANSEV